MSTTQILVLVRSPMRAVGETFAAGAQVSLSPLDAASAIESGRAVLANKSDFAALKAAVDAHNTKVCAKQTRGFGEAGRLLT